MPKEFTEARINMIQMRNNMYHQVINASHPERFIKNEVMRVKETISPKQLNQLLGGVCAQLEKSENTVRMATYMKDLYSIGTNNRLFKPKGIPHRARVKPIVSGTPQVMSVGSIDGPGTKKGPAMLNNLIQVPAGGSKRAAVIPVGESAEKNLSADSTAKSRSGNFDDKVNLQSIIQYCMEMTTTYREMKAVYDMLLDLLIDEDSEEWEQIKLRLQKRLKKLDKKVTVTLEEKGVKVGVKVPAGEDIDINVTPLDTAPPKKGCRKSSPKTGKIISSVFSYVHFNSDEGKRRVTMLYQALLKKEWIDESTSPNTFMQLFSGNPQDFHIKWLGAQADLYALVKNLYDQKLITCPQGTSKWVIVGSHFVDRQSKPFSHWNRQKENIKTKKTIELLINLLNFSIPLGDFTRR